MKQRQYPSPIHLLILIFFTIIFAAHASSSPEQPYQWRNITVGAGGFAPNIIYSTAEEGLAYLRTDMGGVYRWDTKKSEWLPLQDGMTQSSYFGIESLAADPNDPNIVHVAAGMYKRFNAAMLRSFDRGNTWEITKVPFRMGGNEDGRGMGERLAIDPNNTKILYFGSRHDGLFRSTDQGKSWAPVTSFPHKGLGIPPNGWDTNAGISFVHFDKQSKTATGSATIFVAIADPVEQHLYRSDDAGATWQAITNQPDAKLRPAQGVLTGDIFYITYSNNMGPNGVTDGAVYALNIRTNAWQDITPGHNDTPSKRGTHPAGGFMGISVAANDPNTLVVATMNRWLPHDTIFHSTDGGQHWVEFEKRSQRDVSATPYLFWGNPESDFGWWIAGIAINPFNTEEVVYTTGATMYRTQEISNPGTVHWKPWIKGIDQTAVITLRSMPVGPELLSGFGDISGFAHTDFNVSPQVMFTTPVFANTNTIEYAGQNPKIVVRSGTHPHRGKAGDPTLAYSEDAGMTWAPLHVPAMQLEPNKPAQKYDVSGDYAITAAADGKAFMFLAPTPLITRDKGKTWKKVEGLPLNARPVADRHNPNKFYSLDFANSVIYRSDTSADTFTKVATKGLPKNIQSERPTSREDAWTLLASPHAEGDLWYVSPQGLYRSKDGGKKFKKIKSSITVEEMDFGKPAPGKTEPSLLAIGSKGDVRAIWRSDDSGKNWVKITTKGHEYGQRYRCITGDMRHFGRVYIGTDGRGIVMGEIRH